MKPARKRALDTVEKEGHDWERFNTIFGDHTAIMDDIFNRGVRTNIETYVKHKNNFEYDFCKRQLNLNRFSNSPRLHVLTGQVGRGKSAFVDYCRYVEIPALYENKIMQFFIDAHSFDIDSPLTEFEQALIAEIESKMAFVFGNYASFKKAFVRFLGNQTDDELAISGIYKNEINLIKLFEFIDYGVKNESIEITGILVIIDNIDENPKEVLKDADTFVKMLIKWAPERIKSVPLTVLVPVREYNARAYFYTEKHISTDLRKVEEHKVIYKKIQEVKKRIEINLQYPNTSKIIDYFIRVDGKFELKQQLIVINGENVISYLEDFINYLFSSDDSEVISLLSSLSAGNLKILVANVFNILHSNKLPLSDLFEKHFLPVESKSYHNLKEPFDIVTVIECLLSVHFPFYTHRESLIMNMFNCNKSSAPDDYRDLLVIPRLLCLLKNTGSKTVNEIYRLLGEYNYESELIDVALRKCFEYGCFETMYGVKRSHVEDDKTRLTLSTIGRVYLELLICEPVYYQYVCEDTFLPPEYFVNLMEKYPSDERNFHGSKDKRLASALGLLNYIGDMEQLERVNIQAKGFNLEYFYQKMSIQDIGSKKFTGIKKAVLQHNKFKSFFHNIKH